MLRDEHRSDWRGALHSRLSLLASDEEGSGRHPDLYGELGQPAPVRVHDGAGTGPDQRAGRRHADDGDSGRLRAGGDGDGAGRLIVNEGSVPDLEGIKSAQLADVSDRYWHAASQTIAGAAGDGVRNGAGFFDDNSTALERLTHRAIDEAQDILSIPNDVGPDDVNANVLRAKNSVITAALSTQSKVDETRLRRATVDRLPEILKLVAQVEKRLPPPGPIDLELTANERS